MPNPLPTTLKRDDFFTETHHLVTTLLRRYHRNKFVISRGCTCYTEEETNGDSPPSKECCPHSPNALEFYKILYEKLFNHELHEFSLNW